MNEPTKPFSTLAVLSVITGRLLTKGDGDDNGISQMYDLLEWMTGDAPWTHQLPRFANECKPWLLRWFPQLSEVQQHVVEECDAGRADALQGELIERFGKTLSVAKIPRDDHEHKDPYDEMVAMRGTDEGIVIWPSPNGDT